MQRIIKCLGTITVSVILLTTSGCSWMLPQIFKSESMIPSACLLELEELKTSACELLIKKDKIKTEEHYEEMENIGIVLDQLIIWVIGGVTGGLIAQTILDPRGLCHGSCYPY